jgi:hypothetical protein
MERITFGQLLQYLDPVDRVQVVSGYQDWDEADELSVKSELLNPFEDYSIQFMRIEETVGGKPVISVAIEKEKGESP